MSLDTVIDQHVEGASFLWELRRVAVTQPHYSLGDLRRLDKRLEGHLDGLRIAIEEGRWRQGSSLEEPSDFFVAGVLCFGGQDDSAIEMLLDSVAGEPKRTEALVSALGWLGEPAWGRAQRLGVDSEEGRRLIGLSACAVLRMRLETLGESLQSDCAAIRRRALRAVGELGRNELLPQCRHAMSSEDDDVRYAAAWSAMILEDNPGAIRAVRDAMGNGRHGEAAARIAPRRGEVAPTEAWLRELIRQHPRAGLQAAGALGDPALVPELLDHMSDPETMRVAGESFSSITGIGLAHRDLDGDAPEGVEPGPTDEPTDENVEMDPDEHLPWPDSTRVSKCWSEIRGEFKSGVRYLAGKPMTPDWLQTVLRDGFQRQRAAAAVEIAMRTATPLFNVEAPGFRQVALLGKPSAVIR